MRRLVHKLFEKVILHPKITLSAIIITILVLLPGLAHLKITNDFRVYLGTENPQLKAFEKFEADYIKSDSATIVITAKQGDIFTSKGLSLITELTQDAWLIDHALRVSSPANYQYSYALDDEIISNDLIEFGQKYSSTQINHIKQIALSEKRLVKRLITDDGKVALIFISLNLPKASENPSEKVTTQIEALTKKYKKRYPEFDIENGGSTTFNTTLSRAVAHDMSTLLPISYVLIFSGLFLFLRNLFGTLAIFILISLCLITTFSFFGWVSPTLTPIAGFAPSVLLSIMVADSVHILVSYLQYLNQNQSKEQALLNSLQLNFTPILITSLTTIIGFLSLNFSASPPYQDLGNMVSFGVFIALIFSLTFLPALMMLLPLSKSRLTNTTLFFTRFGNLVTQRKKSLLIGMTLVSIVFMAFIPNNKLSDNWANYFDESFSLIQLVKRLDGYLTGINTLEYSLRPAAGYAIFSPEYLNEIDQLTEWLKNHDGLLKNKVVSVNTLSDLMKDLNEVMHGDNPDYFKIPESRELAAQYLLFYEFGLPEGLGLNNLVTIHKDASRLTIMITNSGSDELLAYDQIIQQWLKQNAKAIMTSEATGLGIVFAHIAQRNISSLIWGTFLALLGISFVLTLVFKSVKYGLISLIPNIIPAALAYGFWGMTYGYVDISLSIVACATLGIVVDDTVHFMHKYIISRKQGNDANKAIVESFQRVGIALTTTTVALAVGFIILMLSGMNTSATIGLLMGITLIFALVVDFLLLPPILVFFDRIKNRLE